MTTTQVSTGGKERQVGQVPIEITVRNLSDEILARNGYLAAEAVRTETINHVVVDTGALSLCLPVEIVARLGLKLVREIQVETAAGVSTMRVTEPVSLEVMGRSSPFECLELPVGAMPLLGTVPMEVLGVQPDLRNQTLIQLPEFGPGTYHMAY